jgi:hypothetical protein
VNVEIHLRDQEEPLSLPVGPGEYVTVTVRVAPAAPGEGEHTFGGSELAALAILGYEEPQPAQPQPEMEEREFPNPLSVFGPPVKLRVPKDQPHHNLPVGPRSFYEPLQAKPQPHPEPQPAAVAVADKPKPKRKRAGKQQEPPVPTAGVGFARFEPGED